MTDIRKPPPTPDPYKVFEAHQQRLRQQVMASVAFTNDLHRLMSTGSSEMVRPNYSLRSEVIHWCRHAGMTKRAARRAFGQFMNGKAIGIPPLGNVRFRETEA